MADVWQRTAPLSYQQERMYLFEGLDSSASADNLAFVHWIDGDLDRPALSAEKFIPNPFGTGRFYRSGDVVRYRPDGRQEFVARVDRQLKVPERVITLDAFPLTPNGKIDHSKLSSLDR